MITSKSQSIVRISDNKLLLVPENHYIEQTTYTKVFLFYVKSVRSLIRLDIE